MKNEGDLQGKWWWRALKAVYVLVWIVTLLGLVLLAYFERPQQTPSSLWINIDCSQKENSFRIEPSLPFTSQNDVRFTYSEEEYVKKVCVYGLNKGDYTQFQSVPTLNFTVRTYLEKNGSWWYFPIGFLITFIVVETIKTIILYIMGIGIKRGVLLYVLMFISGMF